MRADVSLHVLRTLALAAQRLQGSFSFADDEPAKILEVSAWGCGFGMLLGLVDTRALDRETSNSACFEHPVPGPKL